MIMVIIVPVPKAQATKEKNQQMGQHKIQNFLQNKRNN